MLSQLRGRQHSRVIDLHAPTTVVWTLQHNTVQRALNLHITVTDRYLECCGLVTVPRPKATLSANGADADAPNDVPTFALMSTWSPRTWNSTAPRLRGWLLLRQVGPGHDERIPENLNLPRNRGIV